MQLTFPVVTQAPFVTPAQYEDIILRAGDTVVAGRLYGCTQSLLCHEPGSLFAELRAGRLALDERVTVSARAAVQPGARMFLRAGESVTVGDSQPALSMNWA